MTSVFIYAEYDDEVQVVRTGLVEYRISIGGTRLNLPPPVAERLQAALTIALAATQGEG